MAVLSNADREAEFSDLMRDMSTEHEETSLSKAELRAAIDAADAWADSNAAEFNSALPAAARSSLNAKQKARILMRVIRRRFEVT